MPDYRRFRVLGGGTYFFTVNLRERPFRIDAWVVLPDHMHCVWTLPQGDDDYSNRWKVIKICFVRALSYTERPFPRTCSKR